MCSSTKLTPAAQYLRISTELRCYSLDNQRIAIAEYATIRGFEIVRTYVDSGKSGLSLRGRSGLKQLLSDVFAQNREFEAVLVFDISRFGRFQDPDEAAHYEFICRKAGLDVRYCQEPFDNDNSTSSNLIKTLKRIMAGEFSRDLSSRLSGVHLRQAGLGFRQGGTLPFGFRRQVVDRNGNPKFILDAGETKALNSDRVVVVPGPSSVVCF